VVNAGAPAGVAIVGCGAISATYAGTLARAKTVRLVGCADLDNRAATGLASRYRTRAFDSPEELIADPRVDVVVALTPPCIHAETVRAALAAGKHAYTEKPLATTLADGQALVQQARARRLRLAAAPDTVLGAAWQTARRLVDDGAIGSPVAAEASFLCPGHELWHPNPGFYYDAGGGPLFDMGPYYLTALVLLLGPIRHVDAAAQTTYASRRPASGPNAGRRFRVAVPTHLSAVLGFGGPVTASLTTSFDVRAPSSSRLVVHGSEGTLVLPDPNGFRGRIELWSGGGREHIRLDPATGPQRRGLGVLDLVVAAREGRPHSASADVALHVLEAMEAIQDAAADGRRRTLTTASRRPAPLGGIA
jgi:predicted dehydrogenase